MLFHTNEAAKLPFVDAAARAHKVWRNDNWARYTDQANAEGALFDWDFSDRQAKEEEQLKRLSIATIAENLGNLLQKLPSVQVGPSVEAIFGVAIGTASEADLRVAWKQLHADGIAANSPVGLKSLGRGTVLRSASLPSA